MSQEVLQHTPFDGVADYITALDRVCAAAQRSLIIFEKDFADIGFNREARYDALRHFLLGSSTARLHLLAHDPQHLIRYCPRMMLLLREFSHGMAIFQTPPHLLGVTDPFAVADDAHYVRRYHFDDTRGLLALNDAQGARELHARFDEMWEASHSGASANHLGL